MDAYTMVPKCSFTQATHTPPYFTSKVLPKDQVALYHVLANGNDPQSKCTFENLAARSIPAVTPADLRTFPSIYIRSPTHFTFLFKAAFLKSGFKGDFVVAYV
jgi:hypothetical protein